MIYIAHTDASYKDGIAIAVAIIQSEKKLLKTIKRKKEVSNSYEAEVLGIQIALEYLSSLKDKSITVFLYSDNKRAIQILNESHTGPVEGTEWRFLNRIPKKLKVIAKHMYGHSSVLSPNTTCDKVAALLRRF